MQMSSAISLGGALAVRRVPRPRVEKIGMWWHAKQFLKYRWRELPLWVALAAKRFVPGLTVMHGQLRVQVRHVDGHVTDYGLVGRHLIVTAGKQFVAACFDNTNEPELFKYHGSGTGATSPAAGDTALQTELTTEYAVNNTRPTGTQAHSAATYTTVGTNTVDATAAVTEWGLFSASSSGTLLDRQTFSVVNLASGDSIVTSYVLTIG